METTETHFSRLAQAATSMSYEPDPYILTPEEEEEALNHHAQQLMEWRAWRYSEKGLSTEEIDYRNSLINFREQADLDRQNILHVANLRKHQKAWHEENRREELQKEIDSQIAIARAWTSEKIFEFMQENCKRKTKEDLIVNDDNRVMIWSYCHFVARDMRLESEYGWSKDKALLVRGVPGIGKTFTAECIANNPLNPITIISMKDVEARVRKHGEYDLKKVGVKSILYLDDVGTEEAEINYYGTKINWFRDFIEKLYSRQRLFNRLIISLNCSFDEVEARYGYRVRSRFKDIFNIINVKGTDMRGKK